MHTQIQWLVKDLVYRKTNLAERNIERQTHIINVVSMQSRMWYQCNAKKILVSMQSRTCTNSRIYEKQESLQIPETLTSIPETLM